jgi:hypothetical protein
MPTSNAEDTQLYRNSFGLGMQKKPKSKYANI